MDKQKQIEELGHMIRYALEYGDFSHLNIHDRNRFLTGRSYIATAEKLYDAGYRKIPENSVGLTRAEHQKYLAYKIIEPQIKGCLDRERELEKRLEKIRKETAEKFAERLKEKLNDFVEDYEDDDGKIDKGPFIIDVLGVESLDGEVISLGIIDEICKEITEGKA